MKRFLVLMVTRDGTYYVEECETICEAVAVRERELSDAPTIAEVLAPLDAYTMAKREAVLAELSAATKHVP